MVVSAFYPGYTSYPILLSISYVLPVVLVIWLWFGKSFDKQQGKITTGTTRKAGFLKLLLTLLLPLLYFFHWTGLQQTKGWPSDQTLPQRFELLSADIQEPNPLKEVKGNIHLWVRPKDNQAPRAYILPYSRALHKKLFETKKRMAQGRPQMGMLYDESSGPGSSANLGNGRRLDFKDAPRRQLPPKI